MDRIRPSIGGEHGHSPLFDAAGRRAEKPRYSTDEARRVPDGRRRSCVRRAFPLKQNELCKSVGLMPQTIENWRER